MQDGCLQRRCGASYYYYYYGRVMEEPVIVAGTAVAASTTPIRWLGVYLDSRLRFKHHVDTWAGRAMRVGAFLRALGNTKRGAPPAVLSEVIRAIVVPTAIYGSTVRYTGTQRQSVRHRRNSVGTGLTTHIGKVHTALATAARAVIPVWRTFPYAAALREAGLPAGLTCLERARLQAATRMACLDRLHPVTIWSLEAPARRKTILQETASLVPQVERPPLNPPQLLGRAPC